VKKKKRRPWKGQMTQGEHVLEEKGFTQGGAPSRLPKKGKRFKDEQGFLPSARGCRRGKESIFRLSIRRKAIRLGGGARARETIFGVTGAVAEFENTIEKVSPSVFYQTGLDLQDWKEGGVQPCATGRGERTTSSGKRKGHSIQRKDSGSGFNLVGKKGMALPGPPGRNRCPETKGHSRLWKKIYSAHRKGRCEGD